MTQELEMSPTRSHSTAPKSKAKNWINKYFWEGQSLDKKQEEELKQIESDAPWYRVVMVKHRRIVALLLPALFFHFWWWGIFIKFNLWYLFKAKYFMSITMVFGSIIAGMTSEGGSSLAYPVMTLAFSINPSVARDFSLIIQSCGMTAAAFAIFFMKVNVEWFSLIFCSLGGLVGIIFGLQVIDPALTPPYKKMGFVCIWFTFAFALYLLNRYRKRTTYRSIPNFKLWKALVLTATGFVGGNFSAIAGSGLDICSFSVLTLLFRVSEKTATPTSVILMAGNTVVGFYWRQIMIRGVSTEAWEFVAVCVPIVVFGAPFGSVIGTHFHRLALASFVYITDTVALISAFCLVPLTPLLIVTSVVTIVIGFAFFFAMTKIGERMMISNECKDKEIQEEQGEEEVEGEGGAFCNAGVDGVREDETAINANSEVTVAVKVNIIDANSSVQTTKL